MSKHAWRAQERGRWLRATTRLFDEGDGRPFERVPNWLLPDFAGNRVRGLGIKGQKKKRFIALALEELSHRVDLLSEGKRWCLVKGVKRREATEEEKAAFEITPDWLMSHVKEDDNGCWIWQGYSTDIGQPQARVTVAPGISATMLVRRLVGKLKFSPSKQFPDAEKWMRLRQAGIKDTCSAGCCHPDHVLVRTKQQAMKNRRGVPLSMEHRMNISLARRKTSKVDDATIMRIMRDPRPGTEIAAELGLHPSYVPHLRTGKLRVFSTVGDNMFAGLMSPTKREDHDAEEVA